MRLVVTIDVEEDNWGDTGTAPAAATNVERLPALHERLVGLGVRPTYLVTYPVACDDRAAAILRDLARSGNCEIGAHCHPWNTPPLEEPRTRRSRMLANLPADLVRRKVQALKHVIEDRLGVTPMAFRSGRWGYGPEVGRALADLGFRVDTSVTPYTSWASYEGPDFSGRSPEVYRFLADGSDRPDPRGPLLEVPATIGFLQANFRLCGAVHRRVSGGALGSLRLVGVLDRLRLVNKVWLSPEVSTAEAMIALSETLRRRGATVLNLVFHSSALVPGLTPFARDRREQEEIGSRLADYLEFTRSAGIRPETLSGLAEAL